ncbi:MAG: B12-binding domain-containing protein, partial [Chloroflexi bacterium]|nr:B12-binding domain-containing protein [Chloroflexota bacterium]
MSDDIIAQLKENVIQGRKTEDDEGIDDDLTGPGVLELTQQALEQNIPIDMIITQGLTAGMEVVGEKFSTKEYF